MKDGVEKDGDEKCWKMRRLAVKIMKGGVREILCRKLRKRAKCMQIHLTALNPNHTGWVLQAQPSFPSFHSESCILLDAIGRSIAESLIWCTSSLMTRSLLIKLSQFISPLGMTLIIIGSEFYIL